MSKNNIPIRLSKNTFSILESIPLNCICNFMKKLDMGITATKIRSELLKLFWSFWVHIA